MWGFFIIAQCRKIVNTFGLWDQLRVDHGTEWYLMLSVHTSLSSFRNRTDREPVVQSSSKMVSEFVG